MRTGARVLGIAGLHLLVLWSFAAAQPLLDLLGGAPEFFVARQNTTSDILLLTFVLTFVPPAVLTALEALALGVSPRLRLGLHLALVAVLVAALALQVLADRAGGGGAVLVLLALVLGAGAAAAYARTRLAPMVLTVLAPAPLLFVLVFLLVSPVSKLVLSGDEAVAANIAVPGDTPVVFILFDELSGMSLMGPDRRIDARRLPAFASLARDATWYRNATTVSDFTDRAVTALLTGERPERGSVPTASDHPENLFTLLGRSYDFDVTEPVTDLCPQRLCPTETAERLPARERLGDLVSDLSVVSLHLLLPEDLRDGLAPIDRSFGDFRVPSGGGREKRETTAGDRARSSAAFDALVAREQQFDAFVGGLGRRSRRPRLSFLHTQLPHNPYVYLPSGQSYREIAAGLPGIEDKPRTPAGVWRADRGLALQGEERYLLQVGYADRQLGRALQQLRAAGLYDRSLIVVMADHGASFEPGTPHRALTPRTIPQIASIPLLVKPPGRRAGRIDDANVSSIDVLPTIASLLGLRLPWRVDGVPAARSAASAITLQPRVGEGTLSIPFSEFVRRRDAAVRRMAADFVLGRREPRLRPGPDGDLVGKPLDGLALAASAAGRFELDDPELLRSVEPKRDGVPALLAGRVADGTGGRRLAVVLNGRVAAITTPYEEGGERRFAVLVPPASFAAGENRLQLAAISGAGSARRLALLGSGDLDFRLVREGGREVIVDDRGRRITVAAGVEGKVDRTGGSGGLVVLEGWAADTEQRRPAERVVAFSAGRLVGAAQPALPRPDLVRTYGPRLAKAGFKLGGATSPAARGAPDGGLRVFAVLDGKASPIAGARLPPAP